MAEEDIPLKDALIESLTENGILPRLQAQLKAAVFLALEKHKYGEEMPPPNQTLRAHHSSDDGILMLSIIRDFFESLHLEQTRQVFTHEAELHRITLHRREEIKNALNLSLDDDGSSILSHLLAAYRQSRMKQSDIEETNTPVPSSSSPRSPFKFNGHGDTTDVGRVQLHTVPNVIDTQNSSPIVEPLHLSDSGESDDPSEVATATFLSQTSKSENRNTTDHPSSRPGPSSVDKYDHEEFDSVRSPTPRNDCVRQSVNGSPIPESNHETANAVSSPTSVHHTSSRSNTPVILIYSQPHRHTSQRQDEDNSDIDCSDIDDDNIPEVLKDYSIGEDSVDQTIDSNESLGLDHVEDVNFPGNSSLAL